MTKHQQHGNSKDIACSLEKEMATHSSVLAWRIPGTGKPGGLLSMGSHRVGHDWSDLAAAACSQSMFPKLSAFYPQPLLALYSSLLSLFVDFFVSATSAHAVSCYKTFAYLFALPGVKFVPALFTWLTPIHHSAINSQISLRRNFL